MTRSEALGLLDQAWSALSSSSTTFPTFVLAFEAAVQLVEEDADPIADQLRRIWGQVEIINALALDEGVAVSPMNVADTASLVQRARDLLTGDA